LIVTVHHSRDVLVGALPGYLSGRYVLSRAQGLLSAPLLRATKRPDSHGPTAEAIGTRAYSDQEPPLPYAGASAGEQMAETG
jgi:hypothetical protein